MGDLQHYDSPVPLTNVKDDETAMVVPLWLGSEVEQHRDHVLGVIPLERALPNLDNAISLLALSFNEWVMVERPGKAMDNRDSHLTLAWESP